MIPQRLDYGLRAAQRRSTTYSFYSVGKIRSFASTMLRLTWRRCGRISIRKRGSIRPFREGHHLHEPLHIATVKLFARFLSLVVVGFHEMTVGFLWRVDVPAFLFADTDRTLPCDR